MSSNRHIQLRQEKGVTLIELMIALMMSSVLIAAIYRTFIVQQKTYTVQDQVADMQQNVRASISRMMSEIRMAGFGNCDNVLSLPGGVNGFTQVITITPDGKTMTIVGGFKQVKRDNGDPILINSVGKDVTGKYTLTLNYSTHNFDGSQHRFISIGGLVSNTVSSRSRNVLTLDLPLTLIPNTGTPIFKIQAVTYSLGLSGGKMVLQRDENTGGGGFAVAENIEDVQFEYPSQHISPASNAVVWMSVAARTDMSDPEFKGGDGFRRRQIASNIYVRNIAAYF